MKTIEPVERTISEIVKLPNTTSGNPRFRISFAHHGSAVTYSDASWCYAVGNPDMREGSKVLVTFTPAGRIRTMSPAKGDKS